MKYYVNTNNSNLDKLNKKNIKNVNIKDNQITFETNKKSLVLLLNEINNLAYFNKRKIKVIIFFKKYFVTILCILFTILFLIFQIGHIKSIIFINDNTYDINVEKYLNNKIEKKFIYNYLNNSIDAINKDLRKEFYYYEWINVTKKGNILYVYIDKLEEKSYLDQTSSIPGDIISDFDGIIRYYFISKGVNLIKDNQSIKKGDILVTGNLKYYNEGEIKYIHPVGIVLGEVVCKEKLKINKKETSLIRTGRIEEKKSYFNNKNENCSFKKYEKSFKIKDYKIFKIYYITYYEIVETYNYFNEEEAKAYSESLLYKKFNENVIHEKEKIVNIFLTNQYEDNDYFYFEYIVKKIINICSFKVVNLEEK